MEKAVPSALAHPRRDTPVMELGSLMIRVVESLGQFSLFVAQVARWLFLKRPRRSTVIPIFYQVGVRSVPVVALTGTFIGMVLAIQAYNQFKMMRLETRLGSVINVSLVTELGPVLAATMLAGRVGGGMAAEISTMKVTEQIDALRCLGADPIHYLVVPRLAACVLLIPLLTVMADFMGVIGGALVTIQILNVDAFYYWQHSREYIGLWEIFTGLSKSIFFGAEIALISCHRGFQAGAGAEGVGRSATEAFVSSFIAILVSDFFLGVFFRGMYDSLWPGYAVTLTSG